MRTTHLIPFSLTATRRHERRSAPLRIRAAVWGELLQQLGTGVPAFTTNSLLPAIMLVAGRRNGTQGRLRPPGAVVERGAKKWEWRYYPSFASSFRLFSFPYDWSGAAKPFTSPRPRMRPRRISATRARSGRHVVLTDALPKKLPRTRWMRCGRSKALTTRRW